MHACMTIINLKCPIQLMLTDPVLPKLIVQTDQHTL